jgi:hypothetical protein
MRTETASLRQIIERRLWTGLVTLLVVGGLTVLVVR